jgi:hypothetical protein
MNEGQKMGLPEKSIEQVEISKVVFDNLWSKADIEKVINAPNITDRDIVRLFLNFKLEGISASKIEIEASRLDFKNKLQQAIEDECNAKYPNSSNIISMISTLQIEDGEGQQDKNTHSKYDSHRSLI